MAAILIPVAASVLYTYSPLEYGFYPRCMFHAATGRNCPGCGATRSLYSLLHGDLPQAFSYNPLFVIALPFLIIAGARTAYTLVTGKKAPAVRLPLWVPKVILVIVIAFAIVRNLDVYPLFR